MIIKIQPPSDMVDATVMYNEKKANGPEGVRTDDQNVFREEDGHVVATRNVPDDSTLEDEFERLRILNAKKARGRNLEKAAFHMSVNPGVNDAPLSEREMAAFIDELMQGMGYGSNPYRIYKHTDIERTHYHVVTCRIGQDGKKINDSFENRRINRLAEKLAKKYGYTVGLDEEPLEEDLEEVNDADTTEDVSHQKERQEKTEQAEKTGQTQDSDDAPKKKQFVPPFNKESDEPITEQFRKIHEEAMKWNFTTPEQYKALLKWRFNVEADEFEDGINFIGLDRNGKEATSPVSEKDLGIDAAEDIIRKCTTTDMKKRRRQRERLEGYALEAIKGSMSLKEFRKKMNDKGIYVVISYTEDGKPFGLTWLDRATKCAFKGSETPCDLRWLIEGAEKNEWVLERIHRFDRTSDIKSRYKSRYRVGSEIKRRIQQKKDEALAKQMMRDQDERSNTRAVNTSELNDDPNNIKI